MPKTKDLRRRALASLAKMSDEEDRKITEAAKSDPDNPEWTEEDFRRAVPYPVHEMRRRGERGPQRAPKKTAISIRLDADVVSHYRASGPGWQKRINDVLRKAAGVRPSRRAG